MLDIGLQPSDVLRLAGLPTDLFSRADLTLSADEYFNFWRGLERAAGSAELPLAIAQALTTDVFDPPLFASFCSPDLQTALQRLATYKRLVGPLHLDVQHQTTHTLTSVTCYGYTGTLPTSVGLAELVFLTWLARTGTRQHIIPSQITLATAPPNIERYRDYFGISPSITGVNSIAFSANDAKRPFLTEDHSMWNFFKMGLNQRLSELDANSRMTERVASVLLEMLPSGQNSMAQVASRLALSPRTLQRQLQNESSSFKAVLNQTRSKLAQHYLLQTQLPLDEISFLLGFQDGNSFNRAFAVWMGATPGEYRRSQGTHFSDRPNT